MYLKLILLGCCVVLYVNAYEGEPCTNNGTAGVCTNVRKCKSAIEEIKHNERPQLCGFEKQDPIVCCVDPEPLIAVAPTVLMPARPAVASTITDTHGDSTPEVGCAPLSAGYTAKKTGQKAFDKCIEYQEKYIYPCERPNALIASLVGDKVMRTNHCHHDFEVLIVGGSEVSKHHYTHAVKLDFGESVNSIKWLCGGSIISENFVLTSAHCTNSRDAGPVKYVQVGAPARNDAENLTSTHVVRNIVRHPEFKPPMKYNDIALLELEKPLVFSQFLVPACLHVGNAVNDERVTSTTWHLFTEMETRYLNKVPLSKVSEEACSAKYPPQRTHSQGLNFKTQMCYENKQSKDLCASESGSAIQIEHHEISCMYLILGVVSFGSCNPSYPEVFTRVSAYIPWIESVVWP